VSDTSELWIVAWRTHGRGRDKQETFTSKGEATQLMRDLLASDTDLLILSRVPVRVAFTVTSVEPAEEP
jgi:hypothetical protein